MSVLVTIDYKTFVIITTNTLVVNMHGTIRPVVSFGKGKVQVVISICDWMCKKVYLSTHLTHADK